ncbi:MAG: shikimate dehydrogenase [Pseudomonadota bacterium]
MVETSKSAFVTGWPVTHSRSPLIHGHWLKAHKLDGDYVKHGVPPEDLNALFNAVRQGHWLGGNVTLPHKEAAFTLVDELHGTAKRLGAVNTVWHQDGRLHGTNTDGAGFLANLDERSAGWDSDEKRGRGALVLGAGGAAQAIVVALQDRRFAPVFIANRTVEKAQKLAAEFGPPCRALSLQEATSAAINVAFIVNTTSVGMDGQSSPISVEGFAQDCLVNDIIYTPLETPLLAAARKRGLPVVDGLGMLLHQAVPGFERWFGVRPTVTEELRTLILRDLGVVA